ncbi:MAG: ABC transporter permease [Bauldia sp.]|nr:ABC transporter permease [Bauldia sp.]
MKLVSKYGIFGGLLALVIVFSTLSDAFLTQGNLLNILRQVSVVGICAVGMTFIIITGGIDLSVGSMIGLSGMICATLVAAGVDPLLAVAATMACGAVLGLFTGFIINEVDIPPLIATLGMMTILRGIAYVISGGLPIYGMPDSIKFLGQGHIAGIPTPVVLTALIMIAGWVVLTRTVFGRQVYGTGGNEEASRLSGVAVKAVKYKVYLIGYLLATFAGLILMARLNSGQPRAGTGYELDIITAVVLGGVSIMGGVGSLPLVVCGVLIMGVLANGMVLLDINEFVQWIVKGGVLLAAVALDRLTHRLYRAKPTDSTQAQPVLAPEETAGR